MQMTNEAATLCEESNSVLLVIDVQTHLTAIMPAKVLARLQRNIGMLLKAAALLEIPVFATEQYPKGLGNLEKDIVDLLPAETRRYEKTVFSCAGISSFTAALQATTRKQVILVGMEAHVCVMQSALDLIGQGYDVFVVVDAICSRHRENYETALSRLRWSGATILDAESVMYEWMRDAGHRHFKSLQAFIA